MRPARNLSKGHANTGYRYFNSFKNRNYVHVGQL